MKRSPVSVIIPAYQSAGTIARAIASVLAQTQPPEEILVIDDGSTDDLESALAPFSSQIKLLRQSNGGAASARNLGIETAQGEWIAFLDADDHWEPAKLERQLAVSKDAGLIGSQWFVESPDHARDVVEGKDASFFGRNFVPHGAEAFQIALRYLWTGVVMVRRKALGENRFITTLETAEDCDLWVRLAAYTPIHLIAEPLATYVQYQNSLSNSNVDRDCRNMLKVVHLHAGLLGARGVREQESFVYRRWASVHLHRGRTTAAIAPAWQRVKRQPLSLEAWWVLHKSLACSSYHRFRKRPGLAKAF